MVYTFYHKQFLPVSVHQAWDFFSYPSNLEKITPSSMQFRIVSDLENKSVYEGMRIEYAFSFIGISMTWVSLISEVRAKFQFKDVQVKGPFTLWEHTHTFKEVEGGVELMDELRYALPLGVLGRLAHFCG